MRKRHPQLLPKPLIPLPTLPPHGVDALFHILCLAVYHCMARSAFSSRLPSRVSSLNIILLSTTLRLQAHLLCVVAAHGVTLYRVSPRRTVSLLAIKPSLATLSSRYVLEYTISLRVVGSYHHHAVDHYHTHTGYTTSLDRSHNTSSPHVPSLTASTLSKS